MANTIGELNVEIGAKLDKLEAGLNRMEQSIGHAGKQSERVAADSFGNIGSIIAGAFSVGAIMNFAKQVIEVRSEFERFESVLANTLGSQSQSRIILGEIQEFAANTPFQLNELSGAFVKLTNYGLKPSMEAMRQYGDLASAVGKGFDQLAEAVADATTGEFERLKEFGIRASKEGDKVTFTFKEQATEVDFTTSAIQDYILSLGDLQGVQGSMIVQMETLGGKVSNLEDNYAKLLTTIGETKVFEASVTGLSAEVENLNNFITILGDESTSTADKFGALYDYLIDPTAIPGQLVEGMENAADGIRTARKETEEWINFMTLNAENGWSVMADGAAGSAKQTKELTTEQKKAQKALIESFHEAGKFARAMDEVTEALMRFDDRSTFKPIDLGDLAEIGLEEEEGIMDPATASLDRYTAGLAVAADAANLFGGVLQSSFDAALMGGQNFFDVFGKALKQMIAQLAAAAASALVLSTIISVFTGGGIGGTFKKMFFGDPTKGGAAGLAGGFGGLILSGTDLTSAINRTQTTTRRTNGG